MGWYHSHTRGDLELSERDLEVHNRWFPEAWQVALVLRPEWMRPTRAAFHVRDAQGLPRQEPEFVVEPLAGVRRTILATPAVPRVEPRQEAPAPPAPAAVPAANRRTSVTLVHPKSCSRGRTEPRVVVVVRRVVVGGGGELSPSSSATTGFPSRRLRCKSPCRTWVASLPFNGTKRHRPFRKPKAGVLEIQDGDRKRVLEMSGPEIRGAGVVVSRQSGRVTVRLVAKLPRGRTTEGWALFEGEPVQGEPAFETAEAANERERLEAEVEAAPDGLVDTEAAKPRPGGRPRRAAEAAGRGAMSYSWRTESLT